MSIKQKALSIAKGVGLALATIIGYLALSFAVLLLVRHYSLGGPVLSTLIANSILCALVLIVAVAQMNRGKTSLIDLPGAPSAAGISLRTALVVLASFLLVWFIGQASGKWIIDLAPQDDFTKYQESITSASIPLILITTIIAAPVTEELLMRGVVYSRLRSVMPVWPAALSSSLVFGLLHGTLVHMAYAVTLGVMLALVYEATHRIWLPIALHVGYNFLAFVPQGVTDAASSLPWVTAGNIAVATVLLLLPRLLSQVEPDQRGPASIDQT